jgi:transposase InsO family protein
MREHVKYFTKSCPCCQKMSAIKTPIHGHPFTTSAYEPMVRLNMDFIGPFKTSDETGYILVIIDTFSRWVELYKCDHADAAETAKALLEHFGRFGAPSQIMSDRGSHFVNQVISEFLALVGTEHCLSIAYSKQENAIVERSNKEINRHITAMCFDKQIVNEWDKTIPIVHRILNSHKNTLTNISPADLLFGNALSLDRGI